MHGVLVVMGSNFCLISSAAALSGLLFGLDIAVINGALVFLLIRRMAAENGDWRAPKIHGEPLKLGFEISERTVARRLRRRGDPAKRWLAFLAKPL